MLDSDDEEYLHKAIASIHEGDMRMSQCSPLQRSMKQAEFFQKCKQRVVPSVPEPAWHKPNDRDLFPPNDEGASLPNIDLLRQHLIREGKLHEHQMLRILRETTALLTKEKNLLELNGSFTVCGDFRGQYYDLLKIFEMGGDPATSKYLFLGNYVNRGHFGIEGLIYMYSVKLCYPEHIYLLRGNHECRNLAQYFTFEKECIRKYSKAVYEACLTSFCALPLAAVLDKRFFCVHGGISPELDLVNEINEISRFQEPPIKGLFCDLLWSDPTPKFGNEQGPAEGDQKAGQVVPDGTKFLPNPVRGCSVYFTYEAACAFLDRNELLGIIRGHQAQNDGYYMYRKTPTKKFPSLISIFSAPNYLDVYNNRGAVLKYIDKNIALRQFNASTHPYWLPNFMDAFTWSLPFLGEKGTVLRSFNYSLIIVDTLLAILACCSAQELGGSSDEEDVVYAWKARDAEGITSERRQQIKRKILAVGRMRRFFKILREEAETASELNRTVEIGETQAIHARSLIGGELDVQANRIQRSTRTFDDARRKDDTNERLPSISQPANSEPTGRSPFPLVQAPSTRRGSSIDDEADLQERIRRTLRLGDNVHGDTGMGKDDMDAENEDEEDREIRELADRVALGGRERRRLGDFEATSEREVLDESRP